MTYEGDRLESVLLDTRIEGVDQAKASAAWGKLEENKEFIDQELTHPNYTFYCIRNINDDNIENLHYGIAVFKPNADINQDDTLVTLLLTKKRNGFEVTQDFADPDRGVKQITKEEVDRILDGIASSTSEVKDTSDTSITDIIRRIKRKLA